LLLMLAPAAPHITDEIWARRAEAAGREWTSIHTETWPVVDESAIAVSVREVPVQVNGKLRTRVVVRADGTPAEIEGAVLADPKIVAILNGRAPDRIVVAGGGKLVNIVLRD
jgi:leucyl-tRNA synthetase